MYPEMLFIAMQRRSTDANIRNKAFNNKRCTLSSVFHEHLMACITDPEDAKFAIECMPRIPPVSSDRWFILTQKETERRRGYGKYMTMVVQPRTVAAVKSLADLCCWIDFEGYDYNSVGYGLLLDVEIIDDRRPLYWGFVNILSEEELWLDEVLSTYSEDQSVYEGEPEAHYKWLQREKIIRGPKCYPLLDSAPQPARNTKPASNG